MIQLPLKKYGSPLTLCLHMHVATETNAIRLRTHLIGDNVFTKDGVAECALPLPGLQSFKLGVMKLQIRQWYEQDGIVALYIQDHRLLSTLCSEFDYVHMDIGRALVVARLISLVKALRATNEVLHTSIYIEGSIDVHNAPTGLAMRTTWANCLGLWGSTMFQSTIVPWDSIRQYDEQLSILHVIQWLRGSTEQSSR